MNFDELSVWNAIKSSPETEIEVFDELKHNARTWVGQLEASIVAVGGSIDTHAIGVLPFGLGTDASKWFLEFEVEHEEAIWAVCKEEFISHFDSLFAKQLRKVFVEKNTNQPIETFAKEKMEVVQKLFPSLTQTEINLFVMSGLDEASIKRLRRQKNASKQTFLVLCATLDKINNRKSTGSTPSNNANN